MNPNSKEFLALQKKWYAKLKKDGFDDIEKDDTMLKSWSSSSLCHNYTPETFAIKENYYIAAGHFLYDYAFKSETDRFIWEQHANGTSIRDIVKLLKKKRIDLYKNKVFRIIKALKLEMKKSWQKP